MCIQIQIPQIFPFRLKFLVFFAKDFNPKQKPSTKNLKVSTNTRKKRYDEKDQTVQKRSIYLGNSICFVYVYFCLDFAHCVCRWCFFFIYALVRKKICSDKLYLLSRFKCFFTIDWVMGIARHFFLRGIRNAHVFHMFNIRFDCLVSLLWLRKRLFS